jgi:hypothetical protein
MSVRARDPYVARVSKDEGGAGFGRHGKAIGRVWLPPDLEDQQELGWH